MCSQERKGAWQQPYKLKCFYREGQRTDQIHRSFRLHHEAANDVIVFSMSGIAKQTCDMWRYMAPLLADMAGLMTSAVHCFYNLLLHVTYLQKDHGEDYLGREHLTLPPNRVVDGCAADFKSASGDVDMPPFLVLKRQSDVSASAASGKLERTRVHFNTMMTSSADLSPQSAGLQKQRHLLHGVLQGPQEGPAGDPVEGLACAALPDRDRRLSMAYPGRLLCDDPGVGAASRQLPACPRLLCTGI